MIADPSAVENQLPYAQQGLPGTEITIAELLQGCRWCITSMHIGKWHLGNTKEFAPLSQGLRRERHDGERALPAGE